MLLYWFLFLGNFVGSRRKPFVLVSFKSVCGERWKLVEQTNANESPFNVPTVHSGDSTAGHNQPFCSMNNLTKTASLSTTVQRPVREQ